MQTINVLIGLPGSHKTQYAGYLIDKNKNAVIVSHDNIREMINGRYCFDDEQEEVVRKIANHAMRELLLCGKDLIVDDSLVSINMVCRRQLTRYLRAIVYRNHPVIISAVQFDVDIVRSKEARMADGKGLSGSHWRTAIDKIAALYEPVTGGEIGEFGFDNCIILPPYKEWKLL